MEHFAHQTNMTKISTLGQKQSEQFPLVIRIHHDFFRQRDKEDIYRVETSFTQETTTSGKEKSPVRIPGVEESS